VSKLLTVLGRITKLIMPKINLSLAHKTNLIPTAISLIFKTSDSFDFQPGQFFSMLVAPKEYRSYSCFYADSKAPTFYPNGNLPDLTEGKYLGFMVNTKPNGTGSHFFMDIKDGDKVVAIGANGKFLLEHGNRPKAFIATSTGLAPFVEMIKQTLTQNPDQEILVFFGVWQPKDDFARQFFADYPQVRVITCCDECPKEDLSETVKLGRVTQIIPEMLGDQLPEYDFYICGNQFMVEATEILLREKGSTTIYMEKFGSSK
jgi:toluene monooxygenase electron transfer component